MAELSEFSAMRFKNKMEDISNDLDDTYRTDSVISVNRDGKVELGPCWRKIPPASVEELLKGEPSRLVPVHCRCRGEEISWNQWSDDKPFTSWPTYEEAWTTWVGKMLPYYGDHWKKANIYDAIMLSARRFLPDKALLSAGLCFWNSSSNTLDLPLGMMSVSLLDIAAIAGFRPHGTTYDCTGELVLKTTFRHYFHGQHEAYGNWIAKHNRDSKPKDKSNKVLVFEDFQHIKETRQTTRTTDQEHIAFLLYWLCRYVFCVPLIGINKEWSHLAQVLHERTDVALGELVLASLYRGLQKITVYPFDGKAQGPLWLFQMWLQIYFPDLSPVSTFPADEVMGFSLTNQIPKPHSPRDCFATLRSFKSNPCWTHTLTRRYPGFLRNRFIDGPTSDSALDEEIEAVLTSVVVQRDLLYGGIKTGKYYGVQAEFYGPNHFSRQFGCIQGIPYSGHKSVNCYTSWRDVLKDALKIRGVSNSIRTTKLKPFLTRYLASSETTPGFNKWWHSQTKDRFSAEHDGPFAILYMHCPFRNSCHLEVPGFPPADGEREEGEEGEAKVESPLPTTSAPVSTRQKTTEVTAVESGTKTNGSKDEEGEAKLESPLPTNKNRKRKGTTNAPVSARQKTTEVIAVESGMKTNGSKDEEAEEIDGRLTLNTFRTMKKLRSHFSSDTSKRAENIETEEPEQTEGPLMGTVELGSKQMCSDAAAFEDASVLDSMHLVQSEPTMLVHGLIESNVHEKLKVLKNIVANSASVKASKPAEDDPAYTLITDVVRGSVEEFQDSTVQELLREALNSLGGRGLVNHVVIDVVEKFFKKLNCIKADKTGNSRKLTLLQDKVEQRRDVLNEQVKAAMEAKQLIIPVIQRAEEIPRLDEKIKVLGAKIEEEKRMTTEEQNIADEKLALVDSLRARLSKRDLRYEIAEIKIKQHLDEIQYDAICQLIDKQFWIFQSFQVEICGTKEMFSDF